MTLLRPTMLATDKSISPVMITSVIGNAMSKIGVTSSSRNPRVTVVPNRGTTADATMITAISRPMIAISRVSKTRRHKGWPWSRYCCCLVSGAGAGAGAVTLAMIFVPCVDQLARLPEGKNPVQHNRTDDQSANDGPLPEVRYPEDWEGTINGEQQDGTERGTPQRPAPAEDGHPTDHRSPHGLELEAEPCLGIDRSVTGGVEDTGKARSCPADQKRDQDPLGDLEAVQFSRGRVRPDRVEFSAAARVLHVPSANDQHRHGNQGEHRDSQDRLGAQPEKCRGHL